MGAAFDDLVIDRLTSQHTRAALGGSPDGVTGDWLGCEKSHRGQTCVWRNLRPSSVLDPQLSQRAQTTGPRSPDLAQIALRPQTSFNLSNPPTQARHGHLSAILSLALTQSSQARRVASPGPILSARARSRELLYDPPRPPSRLVRVHRGRQQTARRRLMPL